MSNENKLDSLKIYGCGGSGSNIIQQLGLPSTSSYFPKSSICVIDTSDSNINNGVIEDNVFLIPGVDGAGGNRKYAHEHTKPHLNNILSKFKPANVNVVVFGLSGGSGSVIGPLLVEELTKRNETVIVVGILSVASKKETENGYNTIGTLQNISRVVTKKPIVISYHENEPGKPFDNTDHIVIEQIRALAMLSSGVNEGIDQKDIYNWLNYNVNTNVTPQLTDLVIYLHDSKKPDPNVYLPIPISVISLLSSKDSVSIELDQLTHCVGFIAEAANASSTLVVQDTHYITTNDYLNERLTRLKGIINKYIEAESKINTIAIPEFTQTDGSTFVF